MRKEIGQCAVELKQGDITLEHVDAIVNAANSRLAGGGGVDGAIHRAGGPEIMAECRTIGGCPTGQTVSTTAGKLHAKRVFHTVGPVWHGGRNNEPALLASCYRTALELAVQEQCDSIAFSSISTGVYHYPVEQAAEVALKTITAFLREKDQPALVRMVLYDTNTMHAYETVLKALE